MATNLEELESDMARAVGRGVAFSGMREKELERQRALRERGIQQARRVSAASRRSADATRQAIEQGAQDFARQSQEALAAQLDSGPVSGARIGAVQQAGRKRAQDVAAFRVRGAQAAGQQDVEAEKRELEALQLEAEATPDAVGELAELNQQLNVFAQSSGVIGEQRKTAQEARRLAASAKTPYARTALLARADEIESGREDV
tara:strand:- start:536 stop:1144 length:609 start_codon:yes stop_codon:yes gene_type:complete